MSIFERLLFRNEDEVPTITLQEFDDMLISTGNFIDWLGTEDQQNQAIDHFTDMAVAANLDDQAAYLAAFAKVNEICIEILKANDMEEMLELMGDVHVKVIDPASN